jgi:nitroreductase
MALLPGHSQGARKRRNALEKAAKTSSPVLGAIRDRWSPRAFANRLVEPGTLKSLLEAARWTASSSNEQPWYYLIARREQTVEFEKMLGCLNEGNRIWARNAPVLMLTVAHMVFSSNNHANRHAFYDLGQATAELAIEAAAHGLQAHQMAGILPDRAKELYAVPQDFEIVTGIALGYPGDPNSLPDHLKERELGPRHRKPLGSFVFERTWGETAGFAKD